MLWRPLLELESLLGATVSFGASTPTGIPGVKSTGAVALKSGAGSVTPYVGGGVLGVFSILLGLL